MRYIKKFFLHTLCVLCAASGVVALNGSRFFSDTNLADIAMLNAVYESDESNKAYGASSGEFTDISASFTARPKETSLSQGQTSPSDSGNRDEKISASAQSESGDSTEIKNEPRNEWWERTRPIQQHIEKDKYDEQNSHLPGFYDLTEYYRNAFYCAKTNNLVGLLAIINKLEKSGKELSHVLERLRTDEGDNLLIYAVKAGSLDVARYLLSVGSSVRAKNHAGETPLSIAISLRNVDLINAISEMQVSLDVEQEEK